MFNRPIKGCALIAAVTVVVILSVALAFSYWYTEFAPGFDETRFSSIRQGMTAHQVKQLIGEPLEIQPHEDHLYNVKTSSGNAKAIITYCKGSVVETQGEVAEKRGISVCMTRRAVEGAFHTTTSKIVGKRQSWEYARAHGFSWSTPHRSVWIEYGLVTKTETADVRD